jgi:hypothetical protein
VTDSTEAGSKNPKVTPKGTGTTVSERKLAKRCEQSFLRMWSWPNVFRDTSPVCEICDLLVVFGSHIIVFSDKECAFPNSGDPAIDWRRWFKKAVLASAEQAWGAERWIRSHPDRVFTDATCSVKVPFKIAINSETVFHRIVVARGSARRIEAELGGSGSLMVNSSLKGADHLPGATSFRAYAVGCLDPQRGFVHVFDEATFDILLDALDTADDFTRYLVKKQALFEGPVQIAACGEEDLLAHYLMGLDDDGHHGFRVPKGINAWFLEEGGWKAFEVHPERLAQKSADKISYIWDKLIDEFSKHQLQGTSLLGGNRIDEMEYPLRIMAAEGRTRRRMLAKALAGALKEGDGTDRFLRVMPGGARTPAYVFLTLKQPEDVPDENYRAVRRRMLEAAVTVARVDSAPNASCVVGIATEPLGKPDDRRSEDLAFIDAPVDDELKEAARRDKKEFRVLQDPKKLRVTHAHEEEFPLKDQKSLMKGRRRNERCPCGSGKKVKACCRGRS